MEELTEAQQRVLDAIKDYMPQNQMPPTVAELADILEFESPNAVHEHLKVLARKGYIGITEKKNRGIMILGLNWCVYCGSYYK